MPISFFSRGKYNILLSFNRKISLSFASGGLVLRYIISINPACRQAGGRRAEKAYLFMQKLK